MITNVITQVHGQQQPSSVTTIIKCDLPECNNNASFDQNTKAQVIESTPWLRAYRTVTTGDGRSIGYCSDTCEVKGTAAGTHNLPEPKKIIEGNAAAVAAAAQQVAAA